MPVPSPARAAAAGLYSTCLWHGLKQRDSPPPVQGSVLQAGAWPGALPLWPEAGATGMRPGQQTSRSGWGRYGANRRDETVINK